MFVETWERRINKKLIVRYCVAKKGSANSTTRNRGVLPKQTKFLKRPTSRLINDYLFKILTRRQVRQWSPSRFKNIRDEHRE